MIDTLMIFAAGYGSRMQRLTKARPKPLLSIHGKPLLSYALELASNYNFKRIVINTHYLAEQILGFIEEFKSQNHNIPEIVTIHETVLLDTGGAVKSATSMLGNQPIFTLNSDVIIKSTSNLFSEMLASWNPDKMDFLMLLQPFNKSVGYRGRGDFELTEDGKLHRPNVNGNYSFLYTGLQILKPELIMLNPLEVFSLKDYYLTSDRIYGFTTQDVKWYHATHPENIADIEKDLLCYQ